MNPLVPPPTLRPWTVTGRTLLGHHKVFSVVELTARSPRTQALHPFFVIEASDWVNIIPITPQGEVVCVQQFRHGSQDITLEIPGGIIDPGETPLEAALRELREETGYRASSAHQLGVISPNPATHANRCYTFLARGVQPDSAPHFDATEECALVLVPLPELRSLAGAGYITNALVMVALYWLELEEAGLTGVHP